MCKGFYYKLQSLSPIHNLDTLQWDYLNEMKNKPSNLVKYLRLFKKKKMWMKLTVNNASAQESVMKTLVRVTLVSS